MITTCQNCNKQFSPTSVTGVPQKYCSAKCRNKSANDRRFERYKESIINEVQDDRRQPGNAPLHKNHNHNDDIQLLSDKIDFLQWVILQMGEQQLKTIDSIGKLQDFVIELHSMD